MENGCIGTYIHGFLDNPSVINYILKDKNHDRGLSPVSIEEFKDKQYDLLADHVRKYVDMDKLYEIITNH